MMKTGIIIQARKGSTRLPGKVMMPFFDGQGILEIILRKIVSKYSGYPVVLATTTADMDDEVANLGESVGVNVFRGSEENVLERFIDVITKYDLDRVIRVCADNPFLDIESFETFLAWEKVSKADYIAYGISETHPTIKTHFGLWAEYVSAKALVRASKMSQEKLYFEHVTNYIYGNPDKFRVEIHLLPNNWGKESSIRFTLDTQEDFDLLQGIYSDFERKGLSMDAKALIDYVKSNPVVLGKMKNEVARWEK